MLLFLPTVEQILGKRLDILQRFSVRGNLWVSHIGCWQALDEVPSELLRHGMMLIPPLVLPDSH